MNRDIVLPYEFSAEYEKKQYQQPHSIYHAPVWEAPGVRKGEINNPGDPKEVYEKTRNTFYRDYKLRKPITIVENFESIFESFRVTSPYKNVANTTISNTNKKNTTNAK